MFVTLITLSWNYTSVHVYFYSVHHRFSTRGFNIFYFIYLLVD